MGYALAPRAFSNTVVGLAARAARPDEQKERWLRPSSRRGPATRHPVEASRLDRNAGSLSVQDRGRRRRVVLNGKKQLRRRRGGRPFFLVATADGADKSSRPSRRGERHVRRSRRHHTPPIHGEFEGVRRSADQNAPGMAPSPARSTLLCAVSARRPSRRGRHEQPEDGPSHTRKTRNSLGRTMARTRRSRTAARRCCWRRELALRRLRRAWPPMRTRSRCGATRWRRPIASDDGCALPDASIQGTAASASRWENDLHFSSSAARQTTRCTATRRWPPRAGRQASHDAG